MGRHSPSRSKHFYAEFEDIGRWEYSATSPSKLASRSRRKTMGMFPSDTSDLMHNETTNTKDTRTQKEEMLLSAEYLCMSRSEEVEKDNFCNRPG